MNPYSPPKSSPRVPVSHLPSSLKPGTNLKGARGVLLIMGSFIFMQAVFLYVAANQSATDPMGGYVPDGSAQDAAMAEFGAKTIKSANEAKAISYLNMIIGAIPLLCGWLVYRFPLTSTIVGAGLVLLLFVMQAATNPASLIGGGVLGVLLKAGILAALCFAIKEAVVYRRNLQDYLSRAPN